MLNMFFGHNHVGAYRIPNRGHEKNNNNNKKKIKISCGALLSRVMPCSLRVILHKKRFSKDSRIDNQPPGKRRQEAS
jgi:hypothetical protein